MNDNDGGPGGYDHRPVGDGFASGSDPPGGSGDGLRQSHQVQTELGQYRFHRMDIRTPGCLNGRDVIVEERS